MTTLLNGISNSSPLLVAPVRDAVAYYVEWLTDILRRSHSDLQFMTTEELVVNIDPVTRRPYDDIGFQESPFTCTVRITDDRGKLYSHSISGWWYPEKVATAWKKRSLWQFWWSHLTSR